MVAVKLGRELEMVAVAAPAYLERFGIPGSPRELHQHRCLNYRWPTDFSLYRWEFERGVTKLEAAVEGRSEEHTSELQSLMRISYAVFCLKKKIQKTDIHTNTTSISQE